MSILWMAGGLASSSPAFAISAAATLPLRWALRPASSSKVSNIANDEGPSWIANQVMVPGSATTSGRADFKNSATSFSLPGLASSGTYSASFDMVNSCNGLTRRVIALCQRQQRQAFVIGGAESARMLAHLAPLAGRGRRVAPGEGDSPRIQYSWRQPPPPTLPPPRAGGGGRDVVKRPPPGLPSGHPGARCQSPPPAAGPPAPWPRPTARRA